MIILLFIFRNIGSEPSFLYGICYKIKFLASGLVQIDIVKQLQCSVEGKSCSVKRVFCSVMGKCGNDKLNELRLGFSNSNLSLHAQETLLERKVDRLKAVY